MTEQLTCADEGYFSTVEPGHAAVRFTSSLNGQHALRVGIRADSYVDVFRFSDEPVYEALGLYRTEAESSS